MQVEDLRISDFTANKQTYRTIQRRRYPIASNTFNRIFAGLYGDISQLTSALDNCKLDLRDITSERYSRFVTAVLPPSTSSSAISLLRNAITKMRTYAGA